MTETRTHGYYIDLHNNTIGGYAKVKDIRAHGLINASRGERQ